MPAEPSLVERVIQFLEPWFADFGYLIVALAALLENSIGAGVVVPGEVTVIAGGFFAARGVISPVWLCVVAAVAGIAGDNIGYWIGRRYGRRFSERFGRYLFLTPLRLAKAEDFYARHGGKTIFLGRFIPVVRSLGCLIAGTSRLRYGRFLVYDSIGAILWSVANVAAGYLLGKGYEQVDRYLGWGGVGAIVLLIVLVAGSAWWRRRRARAAQG
ncbi:MAG TPA: DedA family protein [Actinomycetota bacterium]|nr:DedA family protein [Actinomycetota bacterium]